MQALKLAEQASSSHPSDSFTQLVAECYSMARALHGDLGLDLSAFASHVRLVIERSFPGSNADTHKAILKTLHTSDLYLTAACAQRIMGRQGTPVHLEAAWERFILLYRPCAVDAARRSCRNPDAAREVADRVVADLCLPDRSGRSRIAAYDGRSPLVHWLRVIIANRARSEGKRKDNNLAPLSDAGEMADRHAVPKLHRALETAAYEAMINDSLTAAVAALTDREKALLLLRYREGRCGAEIARSFQMSASTVSREILRTQKKIRDRVVATLLSSHGLNLNQIDECLTEIVTTGHYSILALVVPSSHAQAEKITKAPAGRRTPHPAHST